MTGPRAIHANSRKEHHRPTLVWEFAIEYFTSMQMIRNTVIPRDESVPAVCIERVHMTHHGMWCLDSGYPFCFGGFPHFIRPACQFHHDGLP